MRALYECTNGYMGTSYVRVYVWADSDEHARALALVAFGTDRETRPWRDSESYVRIDECRKLFDASAEPFVTTPNDEGWPE